MGMSNWCSWIQRRFSRVSVRKVYCSSADPAHASSNGISIDTGICAKTSLMQSC